MPKQEGNNSPDKAKTSARQWVKSGQYHNTNDLLKALRKLPQSPYIPITEKEFVPAQGYKIEMHGAGITNSRSRTPILGTESIASCMGIAIYNPDNGDGGLAHLTEITETGYTRLAPESRLALVNLLSKLRTDLSQKLEVRIVGPMNSLGGEDRFIGEVLELLNRTFNLYFLSADFKGKGFPRSFGMDTRRWDEGLLNGGNTSGMSQKDAVRSKEAMQKILDGLKHAVDIYRLTSAPRYEGWVFDARSQFMDKAKRPDTTKQGL